MKPYVGPLDNLHFETGLGNLSILQQWQNSVYLFLIYYPPTSIQVAGKPNIVVAQSSVVTLADLDRW